MIDYETQTTMMPELVLALDSTDIIVDSRLLRTVGVHAGLIKLARKRLVDERSGLNRVYNWTHNLRIAAETHKIRNFMFDFKLYDEANMGEMVRDAGKLKPTVVSIQAAAGSDAIRDAVAQKLDIRLAAHTVDSRRSEQSCREVYGRNRTSQVLSLADLALRNGVDIVIVPACDVRDVRLRFPEVTIMATGAVLPGEEPYGHIGHRAPADIMADGADMFIMGNAFTRADEPEAVLERLVDNLR